MLRAKTVRNWYRIHKWTSLLCTAFLLMLCVTGLPLVFRDEIHDMQGLEVKAAEVPANTPMASLDKVLAAGIGRHPGLHPQFMIWDDDRKNVIEITMGIPTGHELKDFHNVSVDAHTAQVLEEFQPHKDLVSRLMVIAQNLHIDLYAGEGGRLFLGLMGLLFVVSLVTGAIVYGPFMRRLNFGTVRLNKTSRVKWFDLHNMLGIVVLTWTMVVGLTGMVNTFGDLVIKLWEVKTLSAMMAPYKGKPPIEHLVSLDRVLDTAQKAVPGMTPSIISFPGAPYTTTRHFDVLLRGRTPFSSKLVTPVLIDAETGDLTATKELPWHLKAILLSQPLHFGDYGGLPLKILWALFDVAAIIVLISGLYLWLSKRRTPVEEELDRLIDLEGLPNDTPESGVVLP